MHLTNFNTKITFFLPRTEKMNYFSLMKKGRELRQSNNSRELSVRRNCHAMAQFLNCEIITSVHMKSTSCNGVITISFITSEIWTATFSFELEMKQISINRSYGTSGPQNTTSPTELNSQWSAKLDQPQIVPLLQCNIQCA